MQSPEDKVKCQSLLNELLSKVIRLRKRLISCGHSIKQVVDIIFIQFLKLPEINWKNLQETCKFYEIKTSFKVDTNSAQIIMRLQKIVPDLHTVEVLEYLLTVLSINACEFGFNLDQSSSDSNDSGNGLHRLMIRRPRRKLKASKKKKQNQEKREKQREKDRQQQLAAKIQKKVHYGQEYIKNKKIEDNVDNFFKSRNLNSLVSFEDDDYEKQMKRIPQSSDSQN